MFIERVGAGLPRSNGAWKTGADTFYKHVAPLGLGAPKPGREINQHIST